VRPEHKVIKDVEGGSCDLRLTPYRTTDNRIDGVVLSVLTPDGPNGYPSEPVEDKTSRKNKVSATKGKKPAKKK